MTRNCVAYIDLLGVSNHSREDPDGAVRMFEAYNTILDQKISDSRILNLQGTASTTGSPEGDIIADSFNYYIPFSDSIFILSTERERFVRQLSEFILELYSLTARHHTTRLPSDRPFDFRELEIKYQNGELTTEEIVVQFYPVLFRGGIQYGEVARLRLTGIADTNQIVCYSLVGPAVVDAVRMESMVRGPRLLMNEETAVELGVSDKPFMSHVSNNVYEILWPYFHLQRAAKNNELHKLTELLRPAVYMWIAHSHGKYAEHYFELVKLIVKCARICFGRGNADNVIESIMREAGVADKLVVL